MRIAVIADLHANLPALRAALADIDGIACDAIWCAGDVVGRGPHPAEVIEQLRMREIPTVQGNWDEAVGMDREQSGSHWAGADSEAEGLTSLAWTAARLNDDDRAWLRQLPTTLRFGVEGRTALLFHGSPLKAADYLWAERPSRVFSRVASDEGDDIFIFGHTHETFHRPLGPVHFVAAGSVGCGETDDARARYAVLSVEAGEVTVGFRGVEYDHASVVADMRAAGLSLDLLAVPPTPHLLAEAG